MRADAMNPSDDLPQRTLDVLCCPVTRGPLVYDDERQELSSEAGRLAFPVRDGIPVIMASEARRLPPVAAPEPPVEEPAPRPEATVMHAAARPGLFARVVGRLTGTRRDLPPGP